MPSNGNYTQADLVVIAPELGWPSGYGTPRLKRNHDVMIALMHRFGFTGTVNEIYRDMARQVYYRNLYLSGKGNVAAVAGTSKHGTGEAEDWNSPMTSWTSAMQVFWGNNEANCGYSSSQGRADGEPWHKVSVAEPNATAIAQAGPVTSINNSKTTGDEDDMKLEWDTSGTGWLVAGPCWVSLPSPQIYNLFYRVINSDQSKSPFLNGAKPDTFNRAEVDMMNAVQKAAYVGVLGGPTTPYTLDTAKLSDAIVTALNAKGIAANLKAGDPELVKAIDAGFVRSMTAYANAAAAATKGTVGFDSAKLADAVAQSLQKTGVVTTVDNAAVTGAVLAAINRANAAIGKTLQTPVS